MWINSSILPFFCAFVSRHRRIVVSKLNFKDGEGKFKIVQYEKLQLSEVVVIFDFIMNLASLKFARLRVVIIDILDICEYRKIDVNLLRCSLINTQKR